MKTKLLLTLLSLVTASAYAQPSIPVGGMSPPINRSDSPVVAGAERAEPNTLSLQFGNVAAKPTPQEDPARGTETFADAPQAQPQPGARLLSTAANIYSSKGTQYNPQAQPQPGQPGAVDGGTVGIDLGTTYSATSQAAAPQTREQFENPGNTPQPKSAEKAGQIGDDVKGGAPMP